MIKITISAILILCFASLQAKADDIKEFKLDSGIKVTIEEAPFDPKGHEIINCKGSEMPCLIDGGFPYGTDFSLPRSYLKKLIITYEGKSYSLDSSHMFNAWGNRPLEVKGVIRYLGGHCYDSKHCALRGLFSDAAGSYVAEWVVINGVPSRTVLTSSDDVVHLFMKNIDPPVYE